MPDRADGLPTPRRYFAILAMSFGLALVVIDGSIVSVALPTIARDLGVEPSAAISIVTIYQLVLVMTLLPFSALGTRIGLRRLYQYGQITFCVASALCFFAKSLPFLLVTRAAQALGASAALSVTGALVRSIYPHNRLGRGLALNNVIVSSSAACAPVLGGFILSFTTWPWIFAATVPFAALSIFAGRSSLPDPVRHDEPYDVLAAVLCAMTFGLVISGLESAVHGDSPIVSLAIVAVGAVVGVVFVRRELETKEPILPVDLLAIPAMRWSIIGALCAFIASVCVLLSMPFRLHQIGMSPGEIGAAIAPWPLGMMALGPLSGILSDRIAPGILGSIGMAIAAVGLVLLAFLPADAQYFDIAWRMAFAGSGFGMFLAPNSRFIVGSAPPTRVASAGGMISTVRLTGQTLGATIVAALLAAGLGSNSVPALTAATLAFIAGLCSAARLRPASSKSAVDTDTTSL